MRPKIQLFDNHFGHGKSCANGNANISPSYFDWDRSDTPQSITVFTGDTWKRPDLLERLKRGEFRKPVWLMLEPRAITPSLYYDDALNPEVIGLFHTILTHDMELVESHPAFLSYPHGGTWIEPEFHTVYPKTKNISLIASNKGADGHGTEGHNLRHEIARRYAGKIDLFGNIAGKPFGYDGMNATTGLADYRFTIVIENCSYRSYFSEKLINPLLCGTIPLYWGDPKADEIFSSILPLDFLDQLIDRPDYCEALYSQMESMTHQSFVAARRYINCEDWLWLNVLQCLHE